MPARGSSVFSDDIAIDLGTANTLFYVIGLGIVVDEPSLVAVSGKGDDREILAVGRKAKALIGHTPERIEVVHPMRDGVVADFLATQEMLRRFIKRTRSVLNFRQPRLLIAIPAAATPVERRTVYETARMAGAREVYLIEEPVAAALGAGLPVATAKGYMVVDIGGGTTDIAVLSRGSVVNTRSRRCAGNAMDAAIIRYVRKRHRLTIGNADAERIKIEAGTAQAATNGRPLEIRIRGSDGLLNVPKEAVLTQKDVADALSGPIEEIAEFIQYMLEDLPSDLNGSVCENGIALTGGGALLKKLDTELNRRVGVRFVVPDNPILCVVKGTAIVLEQLAAWRHLLIAP
ncbi:MAG: rod shape-determining protein [Hyphomicrobiaceae bacterium]